MNKKEAYAVSFTHTEYADPMGKGRRIDPTNLKQINLHDKSVKDLGYVCDFPMISNNDRHFSYKIGKEHHIDNIETGSKSIIHYNINQCDWSSDGKLFFFFAQEIDVTGGFRERLIDLRDEFWTETYYKRQKLAIYDPESKIMTDVLDFNTIWHNVFMIPRNWPIAVDLLKEEFNP